MNNDLEPQLETIPDHAEASTPADGQTLLADASLASVTAHPLPAQDHIPHVQADPHITTPCSMDPCPEVAPRLTSPIPPSPSLLPTGMIVLSGGQPLPNLLGLLIIPQPLERLVILHSKSLRNSEEPAKCLRRIARQKGLAEHVDLKLVSDHENPDIQSTRYAALRFVEQYPHLHWILNATGGLKPMSIGLAGLAGHPRCEVIYREQTSLNSTTPWQTWQRNSDGRISAYPWQNGIEDPDFLDRFDAADIANLHFLRGQELSDEMQWHADPMPENVTPEILLNIIRSGPSCNWNWNTLSRGNPLAAFVGGQRFEVFLGGLIYALGIRRIWHSLRLTSQNKNSATHSNKTEIDIVAIHNRRVFLIEAKLVGEKESSLVGQAQQLAARMNQIGGQTASGAVVLPGNYDSNHSLKEFLHNSTKCHIWNQDDMPDLIKNLAKLFQIHSIPEPAAKLHQALREASSHGHLFSTGDVGYHKRSPSHILALRSVLENWLRSNPSRAFCCINLGTGIRFMTLRTGRISAIDCQTLHNQLKHHNITLLAPKNPELELDAAKKTNNSFIQFVFGIRSSDEFSTWLKNEDGFYKILPDGFTPVRDSILAEPEPAATDPLLPSSTEQEAAIACLLEDIKSLQKQLPAAIHPAKNKKQPSGKKNRHNSAPSLPVARPRIPHGMIVVGVLVNHPTKPGSGKIFFSPIDYPECVGNTGITLHNSEGACLGDIWEAKVDFIAKTYTYQLCKLVQPHAP